MGILQAKVIVALTCGLVAGAGQHGTWMPAVHCARDDTLGAYRGKRQVGYVQPALMRRHVRAGSQYSPVFIDYPRKPLINLIFPNISHVTLDFKEPNF